MTNETAFSYRRSAIEGASPVGLVIALYDTLWGDLRRAAAAIRSNDIELRCRELSHAALVLGQLEDWVNIKNGGDLAQSLKSFYAHVRAQMMTAGLKKSAELLESQMQLILHVRGAWQQRDSFPEPVGAAAADIQTAQEAMSETPPSERIRFSQNA